MPKAGRAWGDREKGGFHRRVVGRDRTEGAVAATVQRRGVTDPDQEVTRDGRVVDDGERVEDTSLFAARDRSTRRGRSMTPLRNGTHRVRRRP